MIRAIERMLPLSRKKQRPLEQPLGARHVMITICNRLEPAAGSLARQAPEALKQWERDLPSLCEEFRGAASSGPRHAFFLPPELVDAPWFPELEALCKATGSEVELISPAPAAAPFAGKLPGEIARASEALSQRGWLWCDKNGAACYSVTHGAGILPSFEAGQNASRLREAGCRASFVQPDQMNKSPVDFENALSYAISGGSEAPDDFSITRVRADRDTQKADGGGLLLVPPPSGRDWNRKRFGLFPRPETGELSAVDPPTRERLKLWLNCRITVEARPNWLFIALHTRGFVPENARMLLGHRMRDFYRMLERWPSSDPSLRFHCVTAREFVNIMHAAEAGHSGNPAQFKDMRFAAPAALSEGTPDCGNAPPREKCGSAAGSQPRGAEGALELAQ